MNKARLLTLLLGLAVISSLSLTVFFSEVNSSSKVSINGFNLVAPRNPFSIDSLKSVQNTGAEWIAIVPYAFCNAKTAEISFDHPRQWWGEKSEGVIESIKMAHSLDMKVMLKPHLWVGGQGWAGDLKFDSDSLWQVFESQYESYLMNYVRIADSMNVELICLGTELRQSTAKRNEFWEKLIKQTKSQYGGKLTYAANWDEYQEITFWNQVDYIGVDAYFPLSENKAPTTEELLMAWEQPKMEMRKLSEKHEKPILFTEYGYESIDYNTLGHWKLSKDSLNVNFENQKNAFDALYKTFKSESWWVGGFIWKWHLDRPGLHNRAIKAYTPQDKPAIETIGSVFKSNQ
jgi:hypothetical protein